MDHAVAGHDGADGCGLGAVGGKLAVVAGLGTASATKRTASEWISPKHLP